MPFPFYDAEKLRESHEQVESEYKGVNRDPFERLLIALLCEAAERGTKEIEITVRERDCSICFVREGKSNEFMAMPKRPFGQFKDCITRKCGRIDELREGRFVVPLDATGTTAAGHANVSVAFGDSSLRLTLAIGTAS